MTDKKRSAKAVWAGAVAALIVLILIAMFVSQSAPREQEGITLPPPLTGDQPLPSDDVSPDDQSSDFIAITTENVCDALNTLTRPTAYHQTYEVTVGPEGSQISKQVELWVNGELLHATVTDSRQVRTLISDGQTAYLWYGSGPRFISVLLDDGMTPEDLLGLPNFDEHLYIDPATVTEASYQTLDELQMQFIYVSTLSDSGSTARYWVDLKNGLLYLSDALQNDRQVYSVRQSQSELLAVEDESFSDRFILPDGTKPFTVQTRTLQP